MDLEMYEEMVFETLERLQVPVKIKGPPELHLILVQASGAQAAKFRTEAIRRSGITKSGDNISATGGAGLHGIGELEPLYISWTLYYADDNKRLRLTADSQPDDKWLVPLSVIQRFPAPVQKKIFERGFDISDLKNDEEETEESLVKNINALTVKLKALRAGKVENERLKNLQSDTTGGSA